MPFIVDILHEEHIKKTWDTWIAHHAFEIGLQIIFKEISVTSHINYWDHVFKDATGIKFERDFDNAMGITMNGV